MTVDGRYNDQQHTHSTDAGGERINLLAIKFNLKDENSKFSIEFQFIIISCLERKLDWIEVNWTKHIRLTFCWM